MAATDDPIMFTTFPGRTEEFDPGDCEMVGEMQVCMPAINPEEGPEYVISEAERQTAPEVDIRGVVGMLMVGTAMVLIWRSRK